METIFGIPGETIYFRAMSRGGGSHYRQARELCDLTNREFWRAMSFVRLLLENPQKFEEMAITVNRIHRSVKASNSRIPEDLTSMNVIFDMHTLLCEAIDITESAGKKIILNDCLNRLAKLMQPISEDF